MIPEGPRNYSRGTEESRAEGKALREGLSTRPRLMFSLGPPWYWLAFLQGEEHREEFAL